MKRKMCEDEGGGGGPAYSGRRVLDHAENERCGTGQEERPAKRRKNRSLEAEPAPCEPAYTFARRGANGSLTGRDSLNQDKLQPGAHVKAVTRPTIRTTSEMPRRRATIVARIAGEIPGMWLCCPGELKLKLLLPISAKKATAVSLRNVFH